MESTTPTRTLDAAVSGATPVTSGGVEGDASPAERERLGLTTYAAYHPRDRGSAAGRDHLRTARAFTIGRLHREAGDVLCQPKRRWWGLYEAGERAPTCPRCIEIAARLAASLPAAAPATCGCAPKLDECDDGCLCACHAPERADADETDDDACSLCAGTGIGQFGDPDTSRCSSCGGSGVALPPGAPRCCGGMGCPRCEPDDDDRADCME